MEHSFWQLGDELRGQSKVSEDHKWLVAASRLAEQTRSKSERRINLDPSKGSTDFRPRDTFGFHDDNKFVFNFNMLNMGPRLNENVTKSSLSNRIYNMNAVYQNPNISAMVNISGNKYSHINPIKEANHSHIYNNNNKDDALNANSATDKRFKTLPAAETLPRNEVLGGYIFVRSNDTMQEDLKRQLFGLPPRYTNSVSAITPGLPLFLYNYTAHQLHGIFEVRIRVRKVCKPLEEDAFRPVLHHYDGPKFRLELSVTETLDLLDLCEQAGFPWSASLGRRI